MTLLRLYSFYRSGGATRLRAMARAWQTHRRFSATN